MTKTTVQVPDERGGESNEGDNYLAVAVLISVVVAAPALAHNECGVSDKGAKRYEHTHGQSKMRSRCVCQRRQRTAYMVTSTPRRRLGRERGAPRRSPPVGVVSRKAISQTLEQQLDPVPVLGARDHKEDPRPDQRLPERRPILSEVQPQAHGVLVEGDRAAEVGDGQMNGAETERRG